MNRDVCEHFNPIDLPCDKCKGERMTTLREAAQQALEALEKYSGALTHFNEVINHAPAITALRAALAEPVLNPAPGYCKHCKQYTIEEPLPAEPVQEPVAWRYVPSDVWGDPIVTQDPRTVELARQYGRPIEPLYTSPPQRKPLTEEEIDSIWDSEKAFADIYAIARAIERAHGIGGNT